MTRIYLDTNIFLHARPLADIAWEAYERAPITINITRTNIRELDKQKDQHPRAHIRERARKALQRIEDAALHDVTIRPGVTVHIDLSIPSVDYAAHQLDTNQADDRIVASTLAAKEADPTDPVVLYTHDVGPRITAKNLGLSVSELSDEDRLLGEKDETQKENERLRRELHELQTAAPQLSIAIANVSSNGTVSTLAGAPPPLSNAEIEKQILAAREALPAYVFVSEPDGVRVVGGKHLLSLDALGIPDPNAIPTGERQSYSKRCDTYVQEYRTHLREKQDALLNRSRTVEIDIALHNDGGKVAEDIRITLTAPPHLSFAEHADWIPRPPALPAPPRTNGDIQRQMIESVVRSPLSLDNLTTFHSFPRDFNPPQTGPEIDGNQVTWWVRRLRHTYDVSLGTLYCVLPALTPFTITYRVHAVNAPKPFIGSIVIKPLAPKNLVTNAPSSAP